MSFARESSEEGDERGALVQQSLIPHLKLGRGEVVTCRRERLPCGLEREPPRTDQRIEVERLVEHSDSLNVAAVCAQASSRARLLDPAFPRSRGDGWLVVACIRFGRPQSPRGGRDASHAICDPDVVFRIDRGGLPVAVRLPGVVCGADEVAKVVLERGTPFAGSRDLHR
jgi:hypothetical protein